MKNKQALIKVAEWLENGAPHVTTPDGHELGAFDMGEAVSMKTYQDHCGTACCIAGAIVQFENLIEPVAQGRILEFFDYRGKHGEEKGVGSIARDFLDIADHHADQLFTPWHHFGYEETEYYNDPKVAAAVVRHFVETGVVDWDKFIDVEGLNE